MQKWLNSCQFKVEGGVAEVLIAHLSRAPMLCDDYLI